MASYPQKTYTLGFTSIGDCRAFLRKHCEEKVDTIFADANEDMIDAKRAQQVFTDAIRTFDKIDIKGQI